MWVVEMIANPSHDLYILVLVVLALYVLRVVLYYLLLLTSVR